MKNLIKLFAIFLISMIFIQCNTGSENKGEIESAENETSGIAVEKIKIDDVKNIISNRNGKALFLNVWATWCPPCREEIPAINEVSKKYENEVDFIGLSVDNSDEFEAVKAFTREHINYKVYHADLESDQELIDFLSKDWNGAIPLTIIYDQNGNRKEFILGSRDHDFFKQKIETVIN